MKKNIICIVLMVILVLLMPLLAMRFTNQVNWNLADFIIAGVLLLGAGLTYEFFIRKSDIIAYRVVVGVMIMVALFLIWAELAVGIFGTPWAGS